MRHEVQGLRHEAVRHEAVRPEARAGGMIMRHGPLGTVRQWDKVGVWQCQAVWVSEVSQYCITSHCHDSSIHM